MPGPRIFLSYRRDDAAGYAGRLEEALERQLGPGLVFRDVADTPPGQDFTRVIDDRLAGADAVVVLIGPRWAGPLPDGRRRLDDPGDFVRLEAEAALRRGAHLVPVLLPGATMPEAASLPPSLQALARRQALALTEAHWAAGVDQLVAALGATPMAGGRAGPPPGVPPGGHSEPADPAPAASAAPAEEHRRAVPWLLVLAGVAAAVGAGLWAWPGRGPAAPDARPPSPQASQTSQAAQPGEPGQAPGGRAAADPAVQALQGTWQAEVRYPWGVRVRERFSLTWRDGQWQGQASYLGVMRPIEQAQWREGLLRFETRSQAVAGDERRDMLHRYTVRAVPGRRALAIDWQASGGFGPVDPLRIEALPDEAAPAPVPELAPAGSAPR